MRPEEGLVLLQQTTCFTGKFLTLFKQVLKCSLFFPQNGHAIH